MGATGSIEYTVGEPMRGTKWVVHGKLGQGGMGLVLDVVKARLIPGAMKVLLPAFANVPEFAAKFLEEVKLTARLQHPNVVQVLDFDRLEDGTPFMVMERLRGRTLRAALRETQESAKTWTPANAYAVAAQIAQGLHRAHAHSPSIVHRDVKPENLFLHRTEGSFESVVKVMDFGVAAVVGERDRQRIGTPRYMAPEQVAGDPVSPQTDQYALGLVIYEMLTGHFPWDVNLRDASTLADVHRRLPPAPPSRFCPWLPFRIEAALLKALAKDPAARHDTVHGLVFELRALQSIDSPSLALGEAHSTEPMVGTLAEGGAVVHEEPDTFDRMPAPSVNGPSLVEPELSDLSEPSAGASELSERPSDARESAPHAAEARERQDLGSPGLLTTGGAPADPATQTEAPNERSTGALGPLDTPMTGEAARVLEGPRRVKGSQRTVRKAALALGGSGAALAALLSVRAAGLSRTPVNPGRPLESAASITELAPADRPTEPVRTLAATDAPPAPQPAAAPSPAPAMGPVRAVARSDAGPGGPALRKATPVASAHAPAALPTKPPVPDDGRDELYVPEPR